MLNALLVAALLPQADAAERRLAEVRSAYARVTSATVHSRFTKVADETGPAIAISTVTYFERPGKISCVALRPGEAAPFLTYVTDGKTYRRVENGVVTTGQADPNETLAGAGVTLETLALWSGETLLRPGSRLLPHPLVTNERPAIGPDGRIEWNVIAMDRDRIAIYLDRKNGLIDSILVGAVFDPNTGQSGPRYRFHVERWELGGQFPKGFFKVPKPTDPAGGPGDGPVEPPKSAPDR